MDLNAVAIFASVVEAGSFTAAARQLGMPKTSVSRRIADLERDVGVRLLHRTTRNLRPTDAGRLYYEQSSAALRALEAANRQLAETRAEPAGTIRVSAPVGFAGYFLSDALFEFLATYPRARVEVVLTDEKLNLVDAGIDVAFRTGPLADSTLVARRLGSTHRVLCASPAYLAARGTPADVADLARHDCVILGGSINGAHWSLDGPAGATTFAVSGRIAANTMELAYVAAVQGHGIAQIPATIAEPAFRDGELAPVLEDYTAGSGGIHALYPSSRHLAPAVKAFVDLAARHLAASHGDPNWPAAPYEAG